jgi:lysophospholipase L1-like esterase
MKSLLFSFLLIALLIPMESTLQAQDWANLNRFEAANAEIGPVKEGERRVVFIGDSITEGWSELFSEFFEGKPHVNRGISGQTTGQMLIRFRQDVIELRPQTVVILAGTNDIAQNQGPTTLQAIVNNIASMAELGYANGMNVIIGSVLPAFDYPWRPGLEPNTKIPMLNAMLMDYAGSRGFMYLDYFSAMTDGNNGLQADLTTDGVHLTPQGYEMMSAIVTAAIQ